MLVVACELIGPAAVLDGLVTALLLSSGGWKDGRPSRARRTPAGGGASAPPLPPRTALLPRVSNVRRARSKRACASVAGK